jgi:hypothetical protein
MSVAIEFIKSATEILPSAHDAAYGAIAFVGTLGFVLGGYAFLKALDGDSKPEQPVNIIKSRHPEISANPK